MIPTVCIISGRLRKVAWPAKSWRRFGVNCVLIVVIALSTINSVLWLQQSYGDGIGFATEPWRNSELLNYVKGTDEPRAIYSNAPDFIFTLTGKTATMIPHKIYPWTKQPNNQWPGEIAAMRETLSQRNGVLVYFNGEERLWYLPSENDLKTSLPLQIVKTATDGRIYSLKNVAASSQKR